MPFLNTGCQRAPFRMLFLRRFRCCFHLEPFVLTVIMMPSQPRGLCHTNQNVTTGGTNYNRHINVSVYAVTYIGLYIGLGELILSNEVQEFSKFTNFWFSSRPISRMTTFSLSHSLNGSLYVDYVDYCLMNKAYFNQLSIYQRLWFETQDLACRHFFCVHCALVTHY